MYFWDTLKMKEKGSSERLVTAYWTARCQNPEYPKAHLSRQEKLKSHSTVVMNL
jgi:hypothetical protein